MIRRRCGVCSIKRNNHFPCRCGGYFCASHRYIEEHKCTKTQEYQEEQEKYLEKQLVKIESTKVCKI